MSRIQQAIFLHDDYALRPVAYTDPKHTGMVVQVDTDAMYLAFHFDSADDAAKFGRAILDAADKHRASQRTKQEALDDNILDAVCTNPNEE